MVTIPSHLGMLTPFLGRPGPMNQTWASPLQSTSPGISTALGNGAFSMKLQGAPTHPLWDFQKQFLETGFARYQGWQDRGLLVLPTGAGKTLAAMSFVQGMLLHWGGLQTYSPQNGEHVHLPPAGVLFVSHRDYLVQRLADEAGALFGANAVGIFQGDRKNPNAAIVSASVQTLLANADDFPWERFGLVVFDEAHHYVPENLSWSLPLRRMGFMAEDGSITGNWPKFALGLTATPERLGGTPLQNVWGPEGLVHAVDVVDLWAREEKVIHKPELIDVNLTEDVSTLSGKALGELLSTLFYDELTRGEQFHHSIVFVSGVDQIAGTVAQLNEFGISAEGIMGETPQAERDAIFERFRSGATRVLVNFGVVDEGLNIESVEVAVLAYSSNSRRRVVQHIGRVSRLDSPSALVVDLGGNMRRHHLEIQARAIYAQEGKTLAKKEVGEARGARPAPKRSGTSAIASSGKVEIISNKPVTTQIETTFSHLNISATDITRAAYHLNMSADRIFAYANGLAVPASLEEVIQMARELGDANNTLQAAWAHERVAQMALTHPYPPDTSEEYAAFYDWLRYGLWYRHGGTLPDVHEISTMMLERYLHGLQKLEEVYQSKSWFEEALSLIEAFGSDEEQQQQGFNFLNAALPAEYGKLELKMISLTREERALLLYQQQAQSIINAHLKKIPTGEANVLRLLVTALLTAHPEFRGKLKTIMDDLPIQNQTSPLRKWIEEDDVTFSAGLVPNEFYGQVKTLLTQHLGVSKEDSEHLIVTDIYERIYQVSLPEEEPEELRARVLWQLAHHPEFRGKLKVIMEDLPAQNQTSPLRMWIEEDDVTFSNRLAPDKFYRQVKMLLTQHLGVSEADAKRFIEADHRERGIFSLQEYQQQAQSIINAHLKKIPTGEANVLRLLVTALLTAHPEFRGKLKTIMDDLPIQNQTAALRKWIEEDDVTFSAGLVPNEFYGQVKMLLTQHLGVSKEDSEHLIVTDIYECIYQVSLPEEEPKELRARAC